MNCLPESFSRCPGGWMLLVILSSAMPGVLAAAPIDLVEQAEDRRIAIIEHAAPSVVCIYDAQQREGGSGVLIDADGHGLTNYHVIAAMLDTRSGWGGLNDGKLYPLEVLGIDPTGDVAMFRLTGRENFPYAPLGDSDEVKVGDFAIAMGNPFELSEDYSPTVTLGAVTGIHRYQWGVDGNLIYSDCIQVDTPINPGNSGGPLFNPVGEVVGINGRISVDTRGRFNVGFGYAITSNQIKRFVPALRAGLLAGHGSLQATLEHRDGIGLVFGEVRPGGAAHRAGVRPGDRLVRVDGVQITSPNHYVSLLGTYPAGWHLLLEMERAGQPVHSITRLDAVTPKLSAPFVVDREVNLRQVERVLRAFHRRVLGNDDARRPTRWKWKMVRQLAPTQAHREQRSERFTVTQVGDGPIRMRRHYEDGSEGDLIEFDEKQAGRRAAGNGDAFSLPAEIRMVLGAIYILQRWMLARVDLVDLTGVTHTGGGSHTHPPKTSHVTGSSPDQSSLLELIDWPVAEHATARFAFDVDTHLIVRIDVRDVPSGAETTIELSDYRDIGGVLWPCTMTVQGAGSDYCDSLTNWELTP